MGQRREAAHEADEGGGEVSRKLICDFPECGQVITNGTPYFNVEVSGNTGRKDSIKDFHTEHDLTDFTMPNILGEIVSIQYRRAG